MLVHIYIASVLLGCSTAPSHQDAPHASYGQSLLSGCKAELTVKTLLAQVGIMPENGREVIERAAAALGYPQETVFRLRVPEGNPQMMAQPFAGALLDQTVFITVLLRKL